MAEPEEDEDMKQLISSILTCVISEDDDPEVAARLGQGAASLPSQQQPRPLSEVSQQSRSWEELAMDNQFWQRINDTRRMMATRPKIKVPASARQRQRTATKYKAGPQRVSRGTQTRALGIRKLPEAMTTFPIPWGRRLRSVSVGTQTEDTTRGAVQRQQTVSSWDPLPEEVFAMDEVPEWSSESAFTDHRKNMSSSKFADTTFLKLDLSEISIATLFDPDGSLPTQQRGAASVPAEELRHDTDVEVVDNSFSLRVRTVTTNTVYIGWRRQERHQRSRILNRPIALGWNKNPETVTVATQTDR